MTQNNLQIAIEIDLNNNNSTQVLYSNASSQDDYGVQDFIESVASSSFENITK